MKITNEDSDINDFESVHVCAHVFQDGSSCMNVAGPRQHYCRWHRTAAEREERLVAFSKRKNKNAIPDLDIPTIEDPESLQIAIHEVMDAIIDGRLEGRRAVSLSNVKRKLHFIRDRYSVFNLIDDLDEAQKEREQKKQEAAAKRANKKPPQSAKPAANEEVPKSV
jgi:hypothetical protein